MANNCDNCLHKKLNHWERPCCNCSVISIGDSFTSNWKPIRSPQCTTYAQLHEHMVRLYKMCEGTSVAVIDCIRKNGGDVSHVRGEPIFDGKPEEYEFAVGIVEGKPAFLGDRAFTIGGMSVCIEGCCMRLGIKHADIISDGVRDLIPWATLSWNPPRRTIKIGDVEVPAPTEVRFHTSRDLNAVVVHFDSNADAILAKTAFEGKQP